MKDLVIAIDPGFSGGIAYVCPDGVVCTEDMPKDFRDIKELFDNVKATFPKRKTKYVAVLEKVGQHRIGNSASASCTFARHCGHLESILYCIGFDIVYVTPKEWQKIIPTTKFEPIAKDMEKKEASRERARRKTVRKNDIKSYVQEKFSILKVTLKTADALGILLWFNSDKPE